MQYESKQKKRHLHLKMPLNIAKAASVAATDTMPFFTWQLSFVC